MTPTVFISHAGGDTPRASEVADSMRGAGIAVRFDRAEATLGDSFLSFMENSLHTSDYCLLLWSRRAASTPWVQMEWESALYRSVAEKRAFLVAARIEDTPLPQLLAPRLYCDLFPELRPGIDRIIDTWRADRLAEQATKRPVAQARVPAAPPAGASTLYITSDLFAITEPWQTDLDRPAGSLLDDIVERYHLPLQIDYEGRFGVHVGYRLMHREHSLDPSSKLAEQGVADREVVWVETRLEPFAVVAPHGGDTGSQVYRSHRSVAPLLDAVVRAGLGPI
jgi:TIR domain